MTTAIWDLPPIRAHIATHLPLAEMMGLEVTQAGAARSLVRLAGQGHLLRPGGAVAGPVLFAMADTAAYALTIALQHTDRAGDGAICDGGLGERQGAEVFFFEKKKQKTFVPLPR